MPSCARSSSLCRYTPAEAPLLTLPLRTGSTCIRAPPTQSPPLRHTLPSQCLAPLALARSRSWALRLVAQLLVLLPCGLLAVRVAAGLRHQLLRGRSPRHHLRRAWACTRRTRPLPSTSCSSLVPHPTSCPTPFRWRRTTLSTLPRGALMVDGRGHGGCADIAVACASIEATGHPPCVSIDATPSVCEH